MVLFSDTPPVGLLLTDDHAYAVEVAPSRSEEFRILHADRVPMPRGAYSGGVVKNSEILAQTLRELWRKSGISGRRVVLGLPASMCAWRRMDIAPGSHDEQLVMVQNELIPEGLFQPEQNALDFVTLALPPGEEGVPVVVTIVDLPKLNGVRDVLLEAGLTLEAVEPLTVSAVRLAAAALGKDEATTVVLVSSNVADLMIAQGGAIRLQRRITGEWRTPHASRPTFLGEDPEAVDAITPDQNAQALLGEVRRSAAFCQRLAPHLPPPEKVLLVSDEPDLEFFLSATAALGSPAMCMLLESVIRPRVPLDSQDALGGEEGAGCLLALGLALRRIPAFGEANRMNLAHGEERVQLARNEREIRQRALILAGTVAAVNALLWFALGDVARTFQRNARLWGRLAEAVTLEDPHLQHRDRVRFAARDATVRDVHPDVWLELLGGITSPDVQVSTMQLTEQAVNLTAAVSRKEAVLPFSQSLQRYLPLQDSPAVSIMGKADGYAAFTLTARLRGPLSSGEKEGGEAAGPSSAPGAPQQEAEVDVKEVERASR